MQRRIEKWKEMEGNGRIRLSEPEMANLSRESERRHGMTIARIIEGRSADGVIHCDAAMPMREAVRLLAGKRIGALPVMRGGAVVGIFSERDVIYRLAEEGEVCLDRELAEVMTAPPITVAPQTTIDQAPDPAPAGDRRQRDGGVHIDRRSGQAPDRPGGT
jgi:CBS-domain-containing membrane protein